MASGDDKRDDDVAVTIRARIRAGHGERAGLLPTAKDLVLGTCVGPYRIEESIGAGGMGIVYRGRHTELGSPVAIKVLDRALAGRRDLERRMRREAKVMANVVHPGIVRATDIGTLPDGRVYIVMEHLEGETLSERIDRIDSIEAISTADVLRIGAEIADALAAAHERGIVHRDLKPGNVFLVRGDGRRPDSVKILDFGLARLLQGDVSGSFQTDGWLGTPLFMAPEQWQTSRVDHRADLYSVGGLIYQALTGNPPFGGLGWEALCEAHLKVQPRPPSALCGPVRSPPALDDLVLRLLAKDPADRPQTALVVWEALRAMGA